jgi:hypothetical protein
VIKRRAGFEPALYGHPYVSLSGQCHISVWLHHDKEEPSGRVGSVFMLELCLRSDMSRTLIRLYSSIKGRESANVLVRITNAHSFLEMAPKEC